MLANVPDRWAGTPTGRHSCLAYQYTQLPTSTATCASTGNLEFSSYTTRSGFTGSAGVCARVRARSRQRRTAVSTSARHGLGSRGVNRGSSSDRVAAASPTRLTSTG